MTHERTDRIALDADEARCACSQPGPAKARCARAMATVPKGGRMEDWSIHGIGCIALCAGFLDASSVRKAAMPPPAPKAYVRGL